MQQLWRTFGDGLLLLVVLVPLALIGCSALIAWRRRRMAVREAIRRSVLETLFALSLSPALYLVFMPLPGGRSGISWLPGTAIGSAFDAGTMGGSTWLQLAGNALLFLPPAASAALRWPWFRGAGRVALIAGAGAAGIEVMQWLLQAGRVSATDDAILNACGAVAGTLLTRPWWKTIGTADEPAPIDPDSPVRQATRPCPADHGG